MGEQKKTTRVLKPLISEMDTNRRVKVYKMVEGVWADLGTGDVECTMLVCHIRSTVLSFIVRRLSWNRCEDRD